jgi:hypothetical protein
MFRYLRSQLMTCSYSICGWIRVRKCPETEHIITQLRKRCGKGIEIDATEVHSDLLEVGVEGGSDVAMGFAPGIRELLEALGPFALEGAVFAGERDGQPWEQIVAPSKEAGLAALSQCRLEEIDPLLDDLSADDRARLLAKLQASA